MTGVNFNSTTDLATATRFVQYSNGTDTTTDLNVVGATATPLFTAQELSNDNNGDFTSTSTTELIANFDGLIAVTFNVYYTSSFAGVKLAGRIWIDDMSMGPTVSGDVVEGVNNDFNCSLTLGRSIYAVNDGDGIEVRMFRATSVAGLTRFVNSNTSYVAVERLT